MAEYVLTATKTEARAGSFYDRIAGLYDFTFKINGYGRSLDQYFDEHPLPVFPGSRVLDAGCGTGTLTLAMLRNLQVPVKLMPMVMKKIRKLRCWSDRNVSRVATLKRVTGRPAR